jgi:hypothetical protein
VAERKLPIEVLMKITEKLPFWDAFEFLLRTLAGHEKAPRAPSAGGTDELMGKPRWH